MVMISLVMITLQWLSLATNAINSLCVMSCVNSVTNWCNGYYSVLAWFTSCWCVNRLIMAMDSLRMDCSSVCRTCVLEMCGGACMGSWLLGCSLYVGWVQSRVKFMSKTERIKGNVRQ
jgi:hypothetical protein